MFRFSVTRATLAACASLALTSGVALAQTHEHMSHGADTAAAAAGDMVMSSGEVKKIDKDTGKITIQHGPLANLNMPGMTMAFKVQPASMLDQVKVGDQVSFHVERIGGAVTVTHLELAK
jgi:Cu/Ag efflux protein CusF